MYFVSQVDYHRLFAVCSGSLWGLSAAFSGCVIFGDEYNGSKRWLSLGPLSFQPSEFAKVAVILFLACLIDRSKRKTTSIWFMLMIMISILPIVGLVGSNNLSTAIIILGIAVITIFVSNPRYLPFIGIGCTGIGFVAIFPQSGKLSSGTSGHLAKSGGL